MPQVTATPRTMQDGQRITRFIDSVGPAYVTWTYPKEQESFRITNQGLQPIVYTVGSYTDITVQPGQSSEQTVNFTSIQVKSTSGVQAFEVRTDEAGNTFDQPGIKGLSEQIGSLSKNIINVLSYGVKGDGITNNTEKLALAVADIKEGSILYFPPGDYLVTPGVVGGLSIYDKNNFSIIGHNATIFNSPLLITNDNTSTRLVRLNNCSNFTVSGLHFKYQIDWESSPTSEVSGLDQAFQIYADVDKKCENFNIINNTFEYNGPSLNYYPSGVVRKLTILGLASLTSEGNYPKNVTNFNVKDNTFVNCVGRVLYCLGTKNGTISGNKFIELGRLVKPDESVKYYAESVGIRILASKDVSVTGNVISCYSGDLLNGFDMGSPHILVVGSGGYSGITTENVNFTGNTINLYKCSAWVAELGSCNLITYSSNNVDCSADSAYGFRVSDSGTGVRNIKIVNNQLRNLRTFYYFDDFLDIDYENIDIRGNQHIWGASSNIAYSSKMVTRTNIGENYWSDKTSNCKGYYRVREVFAYRLPPMTGNYTRGDICINTGYEEGNCPVVSWVYSRQLNGKNLWLIKEATTRVDANRPTTPTDSAEKLVFRGLTWIDTSIGGNGRLVTFNGVNWMLPDGTTI